jgi:hypothetical protein
MTEQAHGQRLAETFLSMINTHDPGLLDRFVVAGDDQVLHWVRRRAEHARRLVRSVTESLHATINHREPTWPPSTVHS